ncbi:MAG: DUF6702 family protein [Blastocatellales bacterium]
MIKLNFKREDCGFSLRNTWRLCLFVALVIFCVEVRMANPQSATGNLKFNFGHSLSHKIHVSVAQIEFDQKSQSVEVVIRVYADDLENALSQHAKRQIKIDPATANKDKRINEAVIAYLRDNFELKSKAGRPVKLAFTGMEWQVDMFWLYVEGKMLTGLDGSQLRNRIFFELFDDQVNIVNTKIQNRQIGLMFEPKDGFKTIAHYPTPKK